uniref:Uncharacterized protein n=1 Tax=Oryza sativa subsp. japonica TaxID=39947 RepID=Q94GX6_ORYSJ|nr:hypothetical protein [Oryza sativa Japonica Group]
MAAVAGLAAPGMERCREYDVPDTNFIFSTEIQQYGGIGGETFSGCGEFVTGGEGSYGSRNRCLPRQRRCGVHQEASTVALELFSGDHRDDQKE